MLLMLDDEEEENSRIASARSGDPFVIALVINSEHSFIEDENKV